MSLEKWSSDGIEAYLCSNEDQRKVVEVFVRYIHKKNPKEIMMKKVVESIMYYAETRLNNVYLNYTGAVESYWKSWL